MEAREKSEPVVIKISDLKPNFKVQSAIVKEGGKEISSQLDDLNGDRQMDELAFITDLSSQEKRCSLLPYLLQNQRRNIHHKFMQKC